ncbi:hypothetical protein R3X26_18590 [Vibrio sp. TH_r3]|uniref:hypothetical protein n=1 Tax=Vibrio sp. TH_r3 TaxID=3082084 RepID=UPI002955BCC5|nr:hypothetical protein [Vibrio sp. TH_r3]MDV7106392.1 hypothetical protein [Vibrio sp. TH_r3]
MQSFEIVYGKADSYRAMDLGELLTEVTRLYNAAHSFLKELDESLVSMNPTDTRINEMLISFEQYLAEVVKAETTRCKKYKHGEIKTEVYRNYPLCMHQGGLYSYIPLDVVSLSYNSPLSVVYKGSFMALALSVAICGGEIDFDIKAGKIKASTSGVANTIREIRGTFISEESVKLIQVRERELLSAKYPENFEEPDDS